MTANYAKCTTCGIDLATPADAEQHRHETFEAARNTPGAETRGHATRVVNPTPEEVAAGRVRQVVEDALHEAMGRLDDLVDSGIVTTAQVTEELRWFSDFSDEWDEWLQENGEQS